MTDITTLTSIQLLLIVAAGGVGGLAYDYYYKLLTYSTYLSAIWHVVAGAIGAFLTVLSGALGVPTDQTSFLLLAGIGYFGTDVIDSFVQKIQSATSASTPPTAPAGPPAAPPAP